MSLLPNVFSDPKLRARQVQLNAQWNSLWASWQSCDGTPDSAFAEFSSDLKGWRDFFDSETDYSADAKTATDGWQAKAKEWSTKLARWCAVGGVGGETYDGIPTVKDAPPDDPTFFQGVLDGAKDTVDTVLSPFATIGWVALGFAVLVVLAIVWIVTKGRVSGYGVEVGGSK